MEFGQDAVQSAGWARKIVLRAMVYATSYYLRCVISDSMKETIELYREYQNTLYFDGDPFVNQREIEDFIFSIPYFSSDLKSFLERWDNQTCGVFPEEWYSRFLDYIYKWAYSEE